MYRNDRNSRGGGVLLAIKNSIPSKQISTSGDAEMICVHITINHQDIMLCLIYNASISTSDIALSYLTSLSDLNGFIVMGDLNLPDADWDLYDGQSSVSKSFTVVAYKLNLVQLVNAPTHTGGNTLDVLLSNTDIISDTFVQPNLPDCLSSDHFMVSFYIANQLVSQHKSPSMPKFIPNYANADWDGMNSFFLC